MSYNTIHVAHIDPTTAVITLHEMLPRFLLLAAAGSS